MGHIFLASSSPRRKKLIQQMGLECTVLPLDADETMDQDMDAVNLARILSEMKMQACLSQYTELFSDPSQKAWVLTADTLVSLDRHKLGKPTDRNDARNMLKRLQGRSHQVITAYSIHPPQGTGILTDHESTDVFFSPMDDKEIEEYLDTGEWKGVAGAYRIQGLGGKYISSLNGTFYNVMGLPINRIYVILGKLNFSK